MKFAEIVQTFLQKSFGGEGSGDPDEKGKDEPDLENQEGEETGEGGDDLQKSDLVDATEILGALVTEFKDINKSLKALTDKQATLEKSQLDVGEAVVGVAEMVARIAGTPISPKSVMNKGNLGAGGKTFTGQSQITQPNAPPTQEEFERAQKALVKSVQDGEISMQKAEIISSDLQKSMAYPGYAMKPENYEFLARKMTA